MLHFFPRLVQEQRERWLRTKETPAAPYPAAPTLGAAGSGQAGRGATRLSPGVGVSGLSSPLPTFPLDTITVTPRSTGLNRATVFPGAMDGCGSWALKKAEHRRIDAFELWCWRRLSRVPWTARRSNQSILKEISPGRSLEELMLKLKLQYFGHLMQRIDSLEKTLMLGKIEGRRRRGRGRMRWLDGMGLSKLRVLVMDWEA